MLLGAFTHICHNYGSKEVHTRAQCCDTYNW